MLLMILHFIFAITLSLNIVFLTVISFHNFSSHNQQFLHTLVSITKPKSYAEASSHPACQDAMHKEFTTLQDIKTWKVVPLPPNKKATR